MRFRGDVDRSGRRVLSKPDERRVADRGNVPFNLFSRASVTVSPTGRVQDSQNILLVTADFHSDDDSTTAATLSRRASFGPGRARRCSGHGTARPGHVLCCMCGTGIPPTPRGCADCIRSQVRAPSSPPRCPRSASSRWGSPPRRDAAFGRVLRARSVLTLFLTPSSPPSFLSQVEITELDPEAVHGDVLQGVPALLQPPTLDPRGEQGAPDALHQAHQGPEQGQARGRGFIWTSRTASA